MMYILHWKESGAKQDGKRMISVVMGTSNYSHMDLINFIYLFFNRIPPYAVHTDLIFL